MTLREQTAYEMWRAAHPGRTEKEWGQLTEGRRDEYRRMADRARVVIEDAILWETPLRVDELEDRVRKLERKK